MALFNLAKMKDADELSALRDITDDVAESDFIPYACHYDAETLLTKNGELMQTIKIVGFSFEMIDSQGLDLRETIRQAVHDGIQTNQFALWFHTIRRRKNLNAGGEYDEPFAHFLHHAWNERHDWEHKFINELFVTIVCDGDSGNLNNSKTFLRALFPSKDDAARADHLKNAHAELTAVVDRMLNILKDYGAARLGIFEKDGVFYSEPLRFLGKILKLHEEECPLVDVDLSHHLATHDVTFGFDTMEVRSPEDLRRFGAILTIKEYKELSLAAIDEFLQLPEEFIVTQCMDFINHNKALKDYRTLHDLAGISGDPDIARLTGLQDIVDSDHGRPTDYGEHQLTVFLVADSPQHLNRYIERSIEALSALGIVAMREDMKFEDCYWSQLPGNFAFLRRLKPINAARIGGFANLSNYPAGKAKDNPWGRAVTVFNTAANTPYFFNFHSGAVGHTTIVGPYGAGKTVLMNFLLSEARKFKPKMFVFDQHHGSEIFLRALGGNYDSFAPAVSTAKLNPLGIANNEANRNFLLLWLEALLWGAGSPPPTPAEDAALEKALAELMALPAQERSLGKLCALLLLDAPAQAQALAIWHGNGTHASLFDNREETVHLNGLIHGFEMGDITEDRRATPALLLYLLHLVMEKLDGNPSIIVLDEAWSLLENPIFAPRLQAWLEELTRRNTVAVFATESVQDASQSIVSSTVFTSMPTQIYLPNTEPTDAYRTVFGLNDIEYQFLELMDPEERHFLLKKGAEAIVAKLSLDGMDEIMAVLSAQPENLEHMHRLIQEHGDDPESWLPHFIEEVGSS